MPVEIEPETPPMPTQDLPMVAAIPGQEGEARQQLQDSRPSEDGKEITAETFTSATGSAVQEGDASVVTDDPKPDESTSPARLETDLPAQRYGERSRQYTDVSDRRNGGPSGPKTRNSRRGRQTRQDWPGQDRRNGTSGRTSRPARDDISEHNHPAAARSELTPAPRSNVGESRRREQPDDLPDDRGSSKRLRLEHPDIRDQATHASGHRGQDQPPPTRTALSSPAEPRADGVSSGIDRRDQHSRRTFLIPVFRSTILPAALVCCPRPSRTGQP